MLYIHSRTYFLFILLHLAFALAKGICSLTREMCIAQVVTYMWLLELTTKILQHEDKRRLLGASWKGE
jgi:hypothetical protein